MARVTATTFSILGLLMKRPWAAYEATQFLKKSAVRAIWPRTEAGIYQEFKRLEKLEFATAEKETLNGRKRDVYSITPQGRQAFRDWLREPAGSFRVESEPLVKVLYANRSTRELEVQLAHIRSELIEEAKLCHQVTLESAATGYKESLNPGGAADILEMEVLMLKARFEWLQWMEASVKRGAKNTSQKAMQAAAGRSYKQSITKLESLLADLGEA